MSENLQAKPGQLIASPENQSEMDQMFSGLGLDSYIAKKDTGALATSMLPTEENPQARMAPPPGRTSSPKHMSLEEKQRIIKQTESMQRMKTNAQLTPVQNISKAPARGTKDLTQTLMESNLSQMKTSQSLQSFPRSPQPNYTPFGASSQFSSMPPVAPTPSTAPSFNQGYQPWQKSTLQQPVAPAQKPDLSAFDSLLPTMSPKPSMNQMSSMAPRLTGNTSVPFSNASGSAFNQRSPQPVKSLTTNDIKDLLG